MKRAFPLRAVNMANFQKSGLSVFDIDYNSVKTIASVVLPVLPEYLRLYGIDALMAGGAAPAGIFDQSGIYSGAATASANSPRPYNPANRKYCGYGAPVLHSTIGNKDDADGSPK